MRLVIRTTLLIVGIFLFFSTVTMSVARRNPPTQWFIFSSSELKNAGLYRMSIDGGQPLRVGNTVERMRYVGASTAPPRLFFESVAGYTTNIFVVNSVGNRIYQLTHNPAQNLFGSLSVDEAWLYFRSNHSGAWQIYRLNFASGAIEDLTVDGFSTWFRTFSPGDDWLIYETTRGGDRNLYRMRPDGSQPQRLTQLLGEDRYVGWSLDREWILIQHAQDDRRMLDRVHVDTGQRQRLSFDYRTNWYQVLALDGERYIFDPAPDKPLTLYHIQSGDFRGLSTVLPDPNWVIYLSGTSVNSALYRMRYDRSETQLLTSGIGVDWLQTWSPDGEWLYYSSRENGGRNLSRMRSDGSRQQRLTDALSELWFQAWSPDGEWMILTANTARGKPTAIYRLRPDGSHLEQLTFPVYGDHFFETWVETPNLPLNIFMIFFVASGLVGFCATNRVL